MDSVLKVVTSVAPYVTTSNALEAVRRAHEDGFAGLELSEDHLHSLVNARPGSLALVREFSQDRRMLNSLHKTLHRPSIDSSSESERKSAVDYTFQTLDCMEQAGIGRMVMHSFSDLPRFFQLRQERANATGYLIGCQAVKIYALLAPTLKAYRKMNRDKVERSFLRSLLEIAKYAGEKRVGGQPIEIAFEEHYSDFIDYDHIPYGKGEFSNVIRCVDTAHHLIRTGQDSDLSQIAGPIHFHAVDTNGLFDDHRTIGKGRVDFGRALSSAIERRLTNTVVIEDGTRNSALASKEVLLAMIRRAAVAAP